MLVLTMAACDAQKNGFKYEILKKGNGREAKMGDLVKGVMTISSNDSVVFAMEQSDIMFQIMEPMFAGDLNEGLMKLHEGDSARIYISADSMAKYIGSLPPFFANHVIYSIRVDKFYTEEEYSQEKIQQGFAAKEAEKQAIEKYLKDSNLNITPNENGLYFLMTKKGSGKPADTGQMVKVNYAGKRLDGKYFDTNIEEVAIANGLYHPQRPYEPMAVPAGMGQMIPGFDQVLTMMPKGSKAIVIIPFELGYGDRPMGEDIPAYTTLVFELEMVDIEKAAK